MTSISGVSLGAGGVFVFNVNHPETGRVDDSEVAGMLSCRNTNEFQKFGSQMMLSKKTIPCMRGGERVLKLSVGKQDCSLEALLIYFMAFPPWQGNLDRATPPP